VLAGPTAAAVVQQVAGCWQSIAPPACSGWTEPGPTSPRSARGVPTMELDVDGARYFWYHHSEGDTLDKLDPAELARCVAAMAVMAYVTAEMREPLPRTPPRQ
jgi:carboxypeptidase Q